MTAVIQFDDSTPVFQDRLYDSVNRSAKLGWFLTFPRSGDVMKEDLLRVIKKLFTIECSCVVTEPHKDGEPHLHAQFRLKTPLTKIVVLRALQKAFPDASSRIHLKPVPKNKWADQLMYIIDPEKDKETDKHPLLFNLSDPRLKRKLYPWEEEERDALKLKEWLASDELKDMICKDHTLNGLRLGKVCHCTACTTVLSRVRPTSLPGLPGE